MRLWRPTAVYVGIGALAVAEATTARMALAEIALAGKAVTLQLWFLPVYLVLTPVMVAAHRRWGLAVPGCMAAAATLVSGGHGSTAVAGDRRCQLPAGLEGDSPVRLRLAGRHADPCPVAPVRAERGRRPPAGLAGDIQSVPG